MRVRVGRDLRGGRQRRDNALVNEPPCSACDAAVSTPLGNLHNAHASRPRPYLISYAVMPSRQMFHNRLVSCANCIGANCIDMTDSVLNEFNKVGHCDKASLVS